MRVCLERQRLREIVLLTLCVTLGKLLTLSGPDISFLFKGRPCHDWRAGLENSSGYRGPQGHPHEEGVLGKGAANRTAQGQSTGQPHSASPMLPWVNSRGVQEIGLEPWGSSPRTVSSSSFSREDRNPDLCDRSSYLLDFLILSETEENKNTKNLQWRRLRKAATASHSLLRDTDLVPSKCLLSGWVITIHYARLTIK